MGQWEYQTLTFPPFPGNRETRVDSLQVYISILCYWIHLPLNLACNLNFDFHVIVPLALLSTGSLKGMYRDFFSLLKFRV